MDIPNKLKTLIYQRWHLFENFFENAGVSWQSKKFVLSFSAIQGEGLRSG